MSITTAHASFGMLIMPILETRSLFFNIRGLYANVEFTRTVNVLEALRGIIYCKVTRVDVSTLNSVSKAPVDGSDLDHEQTRNVFIEP